MAVKILPPQDYLRECLDYDPETGVLTWKRRPRRHFKTNLGHGAWNGKWAASPAGYHTRTGRVTVCLDYCQYRAHRVIWKWMTNQDPPEEIDHRDGNPQNNCWKNLRLASHAQNTSNRGIQSNNKVGMKGVTWHKVTRKYRAVVGQIHIGYYSTPEEAHAAYCKAAKRILGEFWNPG